MTNQADNIQVKPKSFSEILAGNGMKRDVSGNLIITLKDGKEIKIGCTPAAVKNIQEKFGSLYKMEEKLNQEPLLEDMVAFVECTSVHGMTNDELEELVLKKGFMFFINVARLWSTSIAFSGTEESSAGGK